MMKHPLFLLFILSVLCFFCVSCIDGIKTQEQRKVVHCLRNTLGDRLINIHSISAPGDTLFDYYIIANSRYYQNVLTSTYTDLILNGKRADLSKRNKYNDAIKRAKETNDFLGIPFVVNISFLMNDGTQGRFNINVVRISEDYVIAERVDRGEHEFIIQCFKFIADKYELL